MPIENNWVVASDIGGTHITSAIVDLSSWKVLEYTICRNQVNSRSDAKSILQSWVASISETIRLSDTDIQHLGIAMPGPFDYENGISMMKNQDKYDDLYQVDVQIALKDILGSQFSIRFINDAAAFLQGEVFAGNLQHHPKVLGITLGTGLGSAVWEQGQKAFDADLWNTPYKESIFEEFLVTRWFIKRFFELSGFQEKGFRDILTKHREKEAFETLLLEYTDVLYDFLCYFSEKHGCKTFILGGNISKAWGVISGYNTYKLRQFDIHIGQQTEHAAIIGAGSLFKK